MLPGGRKPAAPARRRPRPRGRCSAAHEHERLHPFRRRRQRRHGRCVGQAGDRARTATARGARGDAAGDAAHDPRRHGEEGRRARRRAARRHHGGQAHGRADPALPSAADRVGRARSRRPTATTASRSPRRCRTTGQTGVEMEALTAASVAALTVYDMCKAVDRGMRIEAVRLTAQVGRQVRRVPCRTDAMMSVEEARARILAGLAPTAGRDGGARRGLGPGAAPRRSRARLTQPPRDVSAMDGYALRAADGALGARLRVIGSRAGRASVRGHASGPARRCGSSPAASSPTAPTAC